MAVVPPPTADVHRRSPLATALVLAAAAAWIGVAWGLAPSWLRSAGSGGSPNLLSRLIAPGTQSLQEQLARWSVVAWSGLGLLLAAGGLLLLAVRQMADWLTQLGPPTCAFVIARSLLWIGFALAPLQSFHGHRVDSSPAHVAVDFDPRSWSRWDSHVYLTIARRGYELYPCDIPWTGAPIARSGMWCGDTPWFPGYPSLVWLLARLEIPELLGGILVSATFCLATLFLVWREFLGAQRTSRNLLVLLFTAFFPGAVYFHAIFPISMATFFMLLSLHLIIRGRWLAGALAGAAAAFTYPGAVFLAPVLAAGAFLRFRDLPWPARVWRSAVPGGAVGAGVALVFAVQAPFVGAWDAFLRTQTQYDISGRMPLLTVRPVLARLAQFASTDWTHARLRDWVPLSVAVGTAFIAVIAGLSILFAIRQRRTRAAPTGLQGRLPYLGIFLVVFWLVPLALPHYSLIRRQSLLLPAAPLTLLLPEWVLGILVALAMLFVPVLGALYFNGTLV